MSGSGDSKGKDFYSHSICPGRSPFKYLWLLISGKNDATTAEIVHEELAGRCDAILSGLTYFQPPLSIATVSATSSEKDKLKLEVIKKLNICETNAMEIVASFLVYEYRGLVKSIADFFSTGTTISNLVNDIYSFYMRERLCLLYSAQIILNEAIHGSNPFSNIFLSYTAAASKVEWCKWLCLSLDEAINEEEETEVLHTISMFLRNCGRFEGVLPEFVNRFKLGKRSKLSMYAEAVVVYSFLQAGSSDHDAEIEKFLLKHVKLLDDNPFYFGAILHAVGDRCERNHVIRSAVKRTLNPVACAQNMIQLVSVYDCKGFRNNHGLGSNVAGYVFKAAEGILLKFNETYFGTKEDWLNLLYVTLKDGITARTFLCAHPEKLGALYNESIMRIPVEIKWPLRYWEAICSAATPQCPPLSNLQRLSEIHTLADVHGRYEHTILRETCDGRWMLQVRIKPYGVIMPPGTFGITLDEGEDSIIICWDLSSNTSFLEKSIWEIMMASIRSDATSEYPNFSKATISNACYLAEFLSKYTALSRQTPEGFTKIFTELIQVLHQSVAMIQDPNERSSLIGILLETVTAGAIYNFDCLLTNYEPQIWPITDVPSLVTDAILTHENVLGSTYVVTKTVLRCMVQLFDLEDESPYTLDKSLCSASLDLDSAEAALLRPLFSKVVIFILENVYPAFVRWRIDRPADKYEIMRNTFRIFANVFKLKNPCFDFLKLKCCKGILVAKNSLLAILEIDETQLQEAWVRPSSENTHLDPAIYYALSMMIDLANYNIDTLRQLDSMSNLTLVQKLGAFTHHRMNPYLPAMALHLLGKMSLELNISLAACFGNGVEKFCYVLQLRLDYKSEAIQLKIAILNFLVICAQTQAGVIEHFLENDSLVNCAVDLLPEIESGLSVASLSLIRALSRKGGSAIRTNETIWTELSKLLTQIHLFPTLLDRQKVISYCMNIFSFEVFRCTVIEKEFEAGLKEVLRPHTLSRLTEIATNRVRTKEALKCILAIKHLISLVNSRPDSNTILEESTRELCVQKIVTVMIGICENSQDEEKGNSIEYQVLSALAELMHILGPPNDLGFLGKVCYALNLTMQSNSLLPQISILRLIFKCISGLSGAKCSSSDTGVVYGTVKEILIYVAKLYVVPQNNLNQIQELIEAAVGVTYCITCSPIFQDRLGLDCQHFFMEILGSVVTTALMRKELPDVVQDCFGCFLKLIQNPSQSNCQSHDQRYGRPKDLSTEVYLPLAQICESSNVYSSWFDCLTICCQLNTEMLKKEKFYFVREALNFWITCGGCVLTRLSAFSRIEKQKYQPYQEQNFQKIQQLTFPIIVVFNALKAMIPYFQFWRLEQQSILDRLLEGIFTTMEACASLLSQPNHLLLLITKPSTKGHSSIPPVFKLTPQLLDLQTRFWEILNCGVHFYIIIGKSEPDLIPVGKLLPLLYNIIGICGRAMLKHGDKKTHPIINVTVDVSTTLEMSLALVHSNIRELIQDYHKMNKEQQTDIRENCSEIATLCDMVRRLGLSLNDFSVKMSSKLHDITKKTLCK